MIYITADIHGSQKVFVKQLHPYLRAGDYLIVAGDMGIGFFTEPNSTEETFFNWIAEQPYTILFIDGNHENFDKLEAYPVASRFGGQVHVIHENFLHLIRGEVFQIDGISIFAFGGGYSLDRYRRTEGLSWWRHEMALDNEYHHALTNLSKHNQKVDIIVTHTGPAETVKYLSNIARYGIRQDVMEETPLTGFLDYVCATVQYKHHYFGHFHLDQELWRNQIALFASVRELISGKIVHKWSIE